MLILYFIIDPEHFLVAHTGPLYNVCGHLLSLFFVSAWWAVWNAWYYLIPVSHQHLILPNFVSGFWDITLLLRLCTFYLWILWKHKTWSQGKVFFIGTYIQIKSHSNNTELVLHSWTYRKTRLAEIFQSEWQVIGQRQKGRTMDFFHLCEKQRRPSYFPTNRKGGKIKILLFWSWMEKVLGSHPNLLEYKYVFSSAS